MSLTQKIAKNTAWQMGGKILGLALSLVAAAITMRYLSTQGLGQYSTILAFLQIFGIVMDFGLYIVLIKKISTLNAETDKLVNNIFTLRVISGVIFLGLAPVIVLFFPYAPIVKIGVLLTTLFYLGISLNQLLSAIFQKFLATYWIALGEFFGKLALLLSTILFIYLQLNLLWIMLALVIGSLVNFGINFFASQKYFKLRLMFDFKIWKEILHEAWPIAISITFSLIYFKGDMVIMSLFRSEAEVGLYGAPYKILEVLVSFPAMFVGLVLPLLTAAWQEKRLVDFRKSLQKAFDFLMIFTLPMLIGGSVLAKPIILLVCGADFLASVPLMQILIWATAEIFLGTLFTYLVVAVDRQKQMIWGYGFVALSSIAAYFLLIPRWSYFAAAGITVYSELAVLLISFVLVWQATKVAPKFLTSFKSAAASLVMGGVLWLAQDANLFFSLCLGGLVYFISLYLFKGISLAQIKEIVTLKQNKI